MEKAPDAGMNNSQQVMEGDRKPQEPPSSIPTKNRLGQFLQRGLRWLLGIFILIGLGYALAVATLYIPATQELDQTRQTVSSELEQARLHRILMSVRADVATARLAIANDDIAGARIALNKTGITLAELETILEADQRQAAVDMQERLKLALDEIGTNKNAAESDLGVLATDLLELENAYFVEP